MELKLRAASGSLAHCGEGVTGVPVNGEWAMEPKYDGWWLAAHVREDKVCFYARSGNTYNGKLPTVEAELLANFPADTWLVGEAVAIRYNADGSVVNEWGTAQSTLTKFGPSVKVNQTPVTFMVFDILGAPATLFDIFGVPASDEFLDTRSLPYQKRRVVLTKIFEAHAMEHVQLASSVLATEAEHKRLVAIGFEGSMLKRLDSRYASGKRGHGLCKWKHVATEDVVIMGFESGTDVGAVVFGQYKDGVLVRRGTCKRKPKLIPTTDPGWVGYVLEVKHNGVMPSGALRHPSAERIRKDKGAEQCLWS